MTPHEIRELRDRLGLTQDAFALKLGVSLQTVWRWEQEGKAKPSRLALKQLQRLSRKLGHPPGGGG